MEPSGEAPLSPEATEQTPYLRETANRGLCAAGDRDEWRRETNSVNAGPLRIRRWWLLPRISRISSSVRLALTDNAVEAWGRVRTNLYEWSGGQLQLVNVLPEGAASDGASSGVEITRKGGAVSGDGSRVFFQMEGVNNAALDVRDTVTGQTVRVDAPAPGVASPPDSRASSKSRALTGRRCSSSMKSR